MARCVFKDSHTNANGCSIVEYQFESVEDLITFEKYQKESFSNAVKSLVGGFDTEDFESEPSFDEASVIDINVKSKTTKH